LKDLSSVFDPWAAHRGLPWFELEVPWNEHPRGKWYWTTDGLGLRRDREPSATAPALRVVVTGDSHTDGVCDNADSFCTLAELELASRRPGESIEVINAGRSSSSFANYLGVLERMLALEPDVFVMVVYGGNDFAEALVWERLVQGMPWPERTQAELDRAAAALALHPAAVAQAFGQLDTLSRSEVARSTSSIAPAEAGAGGEFDARVVCATAPGSTCDGSASSGRGSCARAATVVARSPDRATLRMRDACSFSAAAPSTPRATTQHACPPRSSPHGRACTRVPRCACATPATDPRRSRRTPRRSRDATSRAARPCCSSSMSTRTSPRCSTRAANPRTRASPRGSPRCALGDRSR